MGRWTRNLRNDYINGLQPSDRELRIHGKDVFPERCGQKDGTYEMEFTQRRIHNGRGYSGKGQPTADSLLYLV